tara:strand:- start:16834 stop:16980 length:147 start_codon:yes stop_codon:yes gene_type:complete
MGGKRINWKIFERNIWYMQTMGHSKTSREESGEKIPMQRCTKMIPAIG